MLLIPLAADPSQILEVTLNGQQCTISVEQHFYGLYINISLNGSFLLGGQICENLNRIVRSAYYGFIGDLAFVDTQGTSDPVYTGLGTRFQLVYLSPADVTASQEAWQAYVDSIMLIPAMYYFDGMSAFGPLPQ